MTSLRAGKMASVREELGAVVLEINLLSNVEGELDPRQARRFSTLQAREAGLRAELVATLTAQCKSS